MNVRLYARVSSAKQVKEGNGIDSQISKLTDYCKSKNYKILKTYKDEAISGGSDNREGFNELLKDLKDGEIVLCEEQSRLARDVMILNAFINAIKAKGASVEFTNYEYRDTSSSRLVLNALGAVHQYQKEENRERVIARQNERLKSGYWVFNVPKGLKYTTDETTKQKQIVSRNGEAQKICDIRRDIANKVITVRDGFNRLNSLGIKQSFSTFCSNLRNTLYAGFYELHNERYDIPLTDIPDEYMPVKYETKETYYKLQKVLKGSPTPKEFKFSKVYQEFCVCDKCKKRLSAGVVKNRKKQEYLYYFCDRTGCEAQRKGWLNETLLNEIVIKDLEKTAQIANSKDRIKAVIKEKAKEVLKNEKQKFLYNQQRINAVEKEIESVLDKIVKVSSNLVVQKLEEKMKALENELQELKIRANTKKISNTDFIDKKLNSILDFIEVLPALWANGKDQDKRHVFHFVYGKPLEIDIAKKDISNTVKTPLIAGFSSISESNNSMWWNKPQEYQTQIINLLYEIEELKV